MASRLIAPGNAPLICGSTPGFSRNRPSEGDQFCDPRANSVLKRALVDELHLISRTNPFQNAFRPCQIKAFDIYAVRSRAISILSPCDSVVVFADKAAYLGKKVTFRFFFVSVISMVN